MRLLDRLLRMTGDEYDCEIREAGERWRRHNAGRRATGCRCGRPATKVRYEHRTIGGVPAEIWTCDDHEGVNVWIGRADGRTFEPGVS